MTNGHKRHRAAATNTSKQQSILAFFPKLIENPNQVIRSNKKQKTAIIKSGNQIVQLDSSSIGIRQQHLDHHHRHDAKNRSSIRVSPSRPPSSLPNEIVSLILQPLACEQGTLFECTLVTKQFYVLANPLLWRGISFWDNPHTVARFLACISQTSPERLALNGPHLRGLHMQDRVWTNTHLERLLPQLPHLQWLTVGESAKIISIGIQHLPRHSHRLMSPDVCNAELSVASAIALGRHCRQLEKFNYFHRDSILSDLLAPLSACPLAHVHLTSENKLSVKAMAILRTWKRLTSLTINQRHSTMNALLLAPPPLRVTTTTPVVWPRLTSLSLHPCEDIDDATLVPFLQSHQDLTQLHLELTYELTDTSLDAIAGSLGNLRHLTWTGNDNISSSSVRRLLRQCRDLQSADFSDCDQLMPDLLRSIGCDSLELNHSNIDVIRQESST